MKKIIVIGVIALFVSVGIQPAFAVESNVSVDNIKIEEDIEPKDYLFETIIEIANNPEVKELFKKYSHNMFKFNNDYKAINRQILFKNPRLLFSMLFAKPKMTNEYLNLVYNQGCKIVNIIGEDEALEMIESVKISNPEIFDKLDNIIMNNEEISNRISTLEIMNEELKPDKPLEVDPIVCAKLFLLFLASLINLYIFGFLYQIFIENPILAPIFRPLAYYFSSLTLDSAGLLIELGCIEYPY
jgi:hypothetical protein